MKERYGRGPGTANLSSVKDLQMAMRRRDNPLIGYAAALADFNRLHGEETMVVDVLKQAGLTIGMLQMAGADTHDVGELFKCVRLGGGSKSDQAILLGSARTLPAGSRRPGSPPPIDR